MVSADPRGRWDLEWGGPCKRPVLSHQSPLCFSRWTLGPLFHQNLPALAH